MADGGPGHAERRRQAGAELAAVRAELKRARRSERGWEGSQSRQWALSEEMRRTVLTIHVLSDYTLEPVFAYLRSCALVRGWPDKPNGELENLVFDILLETDAAFIAALTNIDAPADLASMQAAQPFLLEWRTVEWSRQRVMGPRVPPISALMLQQYEDFRLQVPLEVRPACRGAAGDSKAKSWMNRLRQRWGGRYGRLRVRDELPVEVLQQKARMYWGSVGAGARPNASDRRARFQSFPARVAGKFRFLERAESARGITGGFRPIDLICN